MIIISGLNTAQNMSSRRRGRILHEDSLRPGMLGRMEIHEQAKMVARPGQLQRMSPSFADRLGICILVCL